MNIDPCIAYNGEGIQYQEFSCIYPQLESFYFAYVPSRSVDVDGSSTLLTLVFTVLKRSMTPSP